MPAPVLAIWLDSADPALIERLTEQGEMPTLARLRRWGAYGRLLNDTLAYAECGYSMVLTGRGPEQTGTWGAGTFCPDDYRVHTELGNCDYDRAPPFFALGRDHRVAVFDLPKSGINPGVRGLQVTAWGDHSPTAPRASSPPEVLEELLTKYGEHPGGGGQDYANVDDPDSLQRLFENLQCGLQKRGPALVDLWQREKWDLFFASFGETHGAGHYLWPHRDCHVARQHCGDWRNLTAIYRGVDRALGQLLDVAGSDVRVVVFSQVGLRENHDEVPSMALLPELLFRHRFPGCVGLDFDPAHWTPSPESQAGITNWVMELWNYRARTKPFAERLRKRLKPATAARVERLLRIGPTLFHPLTESQLNYQPAMWYRRWWRYMPAFALPSVSHGLIRLNVRGRERHGQVNPANYDRVCDEISGLLDGLIEPGSGQPAVKQIVRTRKHANQESGKRLPDADLVVLWNTNLGNRMECPTHGMLGPVPYHRTATHTPHGFLCAAGPGITAGQTLYGGRQVDIGPTILRLMGAAPTAKLEGRPLIACTTTKVNKVA